MLIFCWIRPLGRLKIAGRLLDTRTTIILLPFSWHLPYEMKREVTCHPMDADFPHACFYTHEVASGWASEGTLEFDAARCAVCARRRLRVLICELWEWIRAEFWYVRWQQNGQKPTKVFRLLAIHGKYALSRSPFMIIPCSTAQWPKFRHHSSQIYKQAYPYVCNAPF